MIYFDLVVVEDPLSLFLWDESVEERLVALSGLVEHPSVDGGSEQIVGRSDRVNVARQVKVEFIHRDDLRERN